LRLGVAAGHDGGARRARSWGSLGPRVSLAPRGAVCNPRSRFLARDAQSRLRCPAICAVVRVLSAGNCRSISLPSGGGPGQESFGLGDGNDLDEPSLGGQAVMDPNQPVGFGERYAVGEFASEDSIFLTQEVVFQSEVTAEKLLNFGDQWVGRDRSTDAHSGDNIKATENRAPSKGISAIRHRRG
jgi:hypothetical protein